jgi:Ca2+:H+ antiporter
MSKSNVHFDGLDGLEGQNDQQRAQRPALVNWTADSNRSLLSAPAAPPEQHRRTSLTPRSASDTSAHTSYGHIFGGLSKFAASRSIHRQNKMALVKSRGWDSSLTADDAPESFDLSLSDKIEPDEMTALMGNVSHRRHLSGSTIPEVEATPLEALKEMFTENKINVLLVFLPFAYVSHAYQWNDGSIFILNFLAMVPLASMLGSK